MIEDGTSQTLASLDEQKLNRSHIKIVITAGMGFFTDAYDLFIIGVVTTLLSPIWHITTIQLALLNGASLASAACGAVVFGYLSDRFGRKKMYGLEMVILFIGAILSAASLSFTFLLIARVLVGFGIGGDYPSSAVVVSEHSNRKNRGFLVLLVFAMQALGLVVGPLFASLLMALNIPIEWVWRILLAFGALPAAGVFYLRRKISETPHYELSKKIPLEASRVVSELVGYHEKARETERHRLFSRRWFSCLVGTAGAWFLLDVAFYGNGVSSTLIMNAINANASLLQHTLLSALIFACFAVPGYFFSAKYVDKIGRKALQIMGFFMMGVCYFLLAKLSGPEHFFVLFLLIFGVSFFFVNFGPNATTFLIPSEIYPTSIRAQAHGLSAAIGKIGAFVGVFFLPIVLLRYGFAFTMVCMGIVSFLGILTTLLVPEMKGKSLHTTHQ